MAECSSPRFDTRELYLGMNALSSGEVLSMLSEQEGIPLASLKLQNLSMQSVWKLGWTWHANSRFNPTWHIKLEKAYLRKGDKSGSKNIGNDLRMSRWDQVSENKALKGREQGILKSYSLMLTLVELFRITNKKQCWEWLWGKQWVKNKFTDIEKPVEKCESWYIHDLLGYN